jgi:tetratricopeptide (TPR) repeat protein
MAKPRLLKTVIVILFALLLGGAWNIGSRLFLPNVGFESLLKNGIHAFRSGQVDEVFAYTRDAVQQQPSSVAAHYILAQSLESMGREDEAIEHYQKVLELNPSQAAPHYNLAVIYTRRKEWEKAIAELKSALAANREFHGARFLLGGLYVEQERYGEAAEELERIIRDRSLDRPMQIQVRTLLARAYTGMGDILKAREVWQKILQLDHTNEEAQEALSELR